MKRATERVYASKDGSRLVASGSPEASRLIAGVSGTLIRPERLKQFSNVDEFFEDIATRAVQPLVKIPTKTKVEKKGKTKVEE